MGVTKTDQLGTSERIHEKIEKIKQFAREAPAVSSDDGAEVQGLRDALRVSERRERELHQRIEVTFKLHIIVTAILPRILKGQKRQIWT